jgi:ankyrin repeat protein
MIVCQQGHLSIVQYLLQNHAESIDLNLRNNYGKTAFMIVCQQGHLSIVQYLLQNHAESIDLNLRNNYGKTAFMIVCQQGHLSIVQYLLQNHAESIDLNARNNFQYTALMLACESGQLSIVQYLLQNHAESIDLYAKDNDRNTVLMLACASNQVSVVQYLLENYSDNQILEHTDFWGYTALLDTQSPQININERNFSWQNTMMLVCYYGHGSVLDYLLEHHLDKIDINAQDICGRTPLIFACIRNFDHIVERLLQSCSNINLQARGVPIPHFSVAGNLALLLLRSKMTAREIAAQQSNNAIIALLDRYECRARFLSRLTP